MDRPHAFYHDSVSPGRWRCPKTGETVAFVWWEETRPSTVGRNACRECHADQRGPAERLHDIAERRERAE